MNHVTDLLAEREPARCTVDNYCNGLDTSQLFIKFCISLKSVPFSLCILSHITSTIYIAADVPHDLEIIHSVLHVYGECCIIEKHIQDAQLPEDIRDEIATIFRERWDKMHSPLHSVGYMLEPQFLGTNFGVEVSNHAFTVAASAQACVGFMSNV